jgi:hypothetical protein
MFILLFFSFPFPIVTFVGTIFGLSSSLTSPRGTSNFNTISLQNKYQTIEHEIEATEQKKDYIDSNSINRKIICLGCGASKNLYRKCAYCGSF